MGMQKKRIIIESIGLLIVIGLGIIYWQQDYLRRQVAHYYYQQAYTALTELDNKTSTNYLIKAINWDPELNSQEYTMFQQKRSELLADPELRQQYFNLNE